MSSWQADVTRDEVLPQAAATAILLANRSEAGTVWAIGILGEYGAWAVSRRKASCYDGEMFDTSKAGRQKIRRSLRDI